jgi:NAD(P)-dependent dehydrogenase (short-subunit alcohol dehydrogenase family)
MKSLESKTALVTGARHGIGGWTAKALAEAGAAVAVCGRKAGDCDEVVAGISASGGVAFDHALDVADLAGVAGRVEAVAQRLGSLDIVVNNAGVIEPMATIDRLDPLAFDRSCRINLSGAAAVVAAAWPHLKGKGHIVNLLSRAGVEPVEGWAAYCATKAGLHMLTRSIDLEGKPQGIRAFSFAPGLVDTDMQAAIRSAKINRISDIPRENLTAPERPAAMIAWLVSGMADDLAGGMIDIRDPEVLRRIGWEA